MSNSDYRYIATCPDGVVQLIAASYLRHGYYWYVTGSIPAGKDPAKIDRKLIEKYEINLSTWARAQRKKRGLANVQYIRHGEWFILMVTEGHHAIKQPASRGGEGEQMKDCRRIPIKLAGYSISYRRSGVLRPGESTRKWHAHVAIELETYRQLKSHFEQLAVHRSAENLQGEFAKVPFARYAPVRRQLLHIFRAVNKRRRAHGYAPVPYSVLSLSRRPVKIFEEPPTIQNDHQPNGERE